MQILPSDIVGEIVGCLDSPTRYILGFACRRFRHIQCDPPEQHLANPYAVKSVSLISWFNSRGMPISWFVHKEAERQGDVEVLRWAHLHSKNWGISEETVVGGVFVLQWKCFNGCDPNFEIAAEAARVANTSLVQWITSHYKYSHKKSILLEAGRSGTLSIIQYARSRNYKWCLGICKNIAESGCMTLLKWSQFKRCPWDENFYTMAIYAKNTPLVQWARFNDRPPSFDPCGIAAYNRDLCMLQWLRANGHQSVLITTNAISSGCFSILQWSPPINRTALNISYMGTPFKYILNRGYYRGDQIYNARDDISYVYGVFGFSGMWVASAWGDALTNNELYVLQWLRLHGVDQPINIEDGGVHTRSVMLYARVGAPIGP